jgi:hypothetical protein
MLLACPVKSSGFAYQAKILIFMIYNGATYIQIPVQLSRNIERPSKAFGIKNLFWVGMSLLQIAIFRITRNPRLL